MLHQQLVEETTAGLAMERCYSPKGSSFCLVCVKRKGVDKNGAQERVVEIRG